MNSALPQPCPALVAACGHPGPLRSGILLSSLRLVFLVNLVAFADSDRWRARSPGAPGLDHASRSGIRWKWRGIARRHDHRIQALGRPTVAGRHDRGPMCAGLDSRRSRSLTHVVDRRGHAIDGRLVVSIQSRGASRLHVYAKPWAWARPARIHLHFRPQRSMLETSIIGSVPNRMGWESTSDQYARWVERCVALSPIR
jgi:hypothetical protein